MNGKMITFANGDDDFRGYLSHAKSGSGPGVIVIQEWWGLVPHIKRVADRFAEAGFTALAPDLYMGESTKEPDEAATMMQALNIAETERILRKAIVALLEEPSVSNKDKVGVAGFCMGGQLALFAAATNPAVGACVDFYGIHPKVHPQLENLKGPVLGIFAENDPYATPEAVAQLDSDLTSAGIPHHFKTYAGADHAFFNDDRPEVYDRGAAEDAWRRTVDFLGEALTSNRTAP